MGKKMIYLIASRYNSAFGVAARTATNSYYNHAGLALTPDLTPMYTYSRRTDLEQSRILGGFAEETFDNFRHGTRGGIEIAVVGCPVTTAEYDYVKTRMSYLSKNIKKTHYNFADLFFAAFKVPLNDDKVKDTSSTCSVFVATIMKSIYHPISDKPLNLILPDDIANSVDEKGFRLIYKGDPNHYIPPVTESVDILLEGDVDNPRIVKTGDWSIQIKVTKDESPYGLDALQNALSEDIYICTDIHIGDPEESWEPKADLIADTINEHVDPNDHLLFLGDIAGHKRNVTVKMLKDFFKKVHCKNIYLILGNNDYFTMDQYKDIGFLAVTDMLQWKNVIFTHCPLNTVPSGVVNIHGHLHDDSTYINGSPDQHIKVWDNQYTPIQLGTLMAKNSEKIPTNTITLNGRRPRPKTLAERRLRADELLSRPVSEGYGLFDTGLHTTGVTLSVLRKEPINDQTLRILSKEFDVEHIRTGEGYKGYIYFDKENTLVAILNTFDDENGKVIIQTMTVTPNYKKTGIEEQLIDVAIHDLHVNHVTISVNDIEKFKLYKSKGFREVGDSKISITLHKGSYINESVLLEEARSKIPDEDFGVPEERKYPLTDKRHVISAIKLFNWVDSAYEEELAKNIIKKIDQYEITDDEIHMTEKNRFSKYYKKG